jgi:sugar/nucleoside kinase (ribokinase family)
MSPLIAGTVCFDTIETPAGRMDRTLGGSAVFASVAAALISRPRLVGAVGRDFTPEARDALSSRGVDLGGLQTLADVLTQFWHGRYHADMHTRDHIAVDLDILDRMELVVPPESRNSDFVFLAHMPPHHQHRVLDQLTRPRVVFADTIDHWIQTRRDEVIKLFGRVTGVVVNDGEAKLLTGESNPIKAARGIANFGPKVVVIKKGEHGVLIWAGGELIALPAVPTEAAVDPTGAGDTFAGAMLAALVTGQPFPVAAATGIVAASFTVEGFGVSRLLAAKPADLADRLARYRAMLSL